MNVKQLKALLKCTDQTGRKGYQYKIFHHDGVTMATDTYVAVTVREEAHGPNGYAIALGKGEIAALPPAAELRPTLEGWADETDRIAGGHLSPDLYPDLERVFREFDPDKSEKDEERYGVSPKRLKTLLGVFEAFGVEAPTMRWSGPAILLEGRGDGAEVRALLMGVRR